MKYLFERRIWSSFVNKLAGKKLFIFLDFDGTLTAIAPTPDSCVLPEAARKLLKAMSRHPRIRLAFISGRQVGDLKRKVGIKNAIYSGNHGLELTGPGMKFTPPVAPGYRSILRRIKRDLQEKVAAIPGALLEDKGLTLSLHYRLAAGKDAQTIRRIFRETVRPFRTENKIKTKAGKMVLEVLPPIEWHKGAILEWILAKKNSAFAGEDITAMYIGDDVTDEDAFRAIKNKGPAIFVGRPRKSYAQFYVRDTGQVRELLRRIIEVHND